MELLDIANQATLTEAAEICGCRRDRIYRAVAYGILPFRLQRRRGGKARIVVDLSDVEVFVDMAASARCGRTETLDLLKEGLSPKAVAQRLGIQYHSALRTQQRAIARGQLRAA